MINFEYAQTVGLIGGHYQSHSLHLLQACKHLPLAQDATGGLVGKLAAKGISPIKKQSISAKNVIFVIDQACVVRADNTTQDECDFLLNGRYWRMVAPQNGSTKGMSWDRSSPVSITAIALPRSLATSGKPPVQQSQPAPMNLVSAPTGGLGQPAPTGFYALVTSSPPPTVPTNHYANMTTVMPGHYASMAVLTGQPESFYANV